MSVSGVPHDLPDIDLGRGLREAVPPPPLTAVTYPPAARWLATFSKWFFEIP